MQQTPVELAPAPSGYRCLRVPFRAGRRAVSIACAGAMLLAAASALEAQEWPTRPIRMVVPFPPGGATDVVARRLAQSMSDALGQQIIIENRGGAGATIGAEAVAKAEPDGYTILYTTAGIHVVNPAIYPKLPYDPLKSWSMVCQLISTPLGVAVRANDDRFKTVQDLIAYAKQNPGKLSYGSAGSGSSLHQSGEMFKHATGTDILHVPYRGAGPAMTDFQGGQVDMMFSYMGSIMPLEKQGKLRILAVGTPQRMKQAPNVPTVAEITGQADYDSDTWTALVTPAGTPPAIVERIRKAALDALDRNRDYLESSGYILLGGTQAELGARIERELKTLTPLLAKLMKVD